MTRNTDNKKPVRNSNQKDRKGDTGRSSSEGRKAGSGGEEKITKVGRKIKGT